MTCQEVNEGNAAQRYLDKVMPEAEREEYDSHIVECDNCLDALMMLSDSREKTHLAALPEAAWVPKITEARPKASRSWLKKIWWLLHPHKHDQEGPYGLNAK